MNKATKTVATTVAKVLARFVTATHFYHHPLRYKLRACGLESMPAAYYGRSK